MKARRVAVVAFATLVMAAGSAGKGTAAQSAALELDQVIARAQAHFLSSEFAELDAEAERLRTTRARTSDGRWKIGAVYDGTVPARRSDEGQWARSLALHEQWVKSSPSSPAAHIALADYWFHYAWKARGGGFANTVTEQGWKLFGERLTTAREVLEKCRAFATRDPIWYYVMLGVAKGEGWDVERYDALFEEAVTKEPDFLGHYFDKANYMLPRWTGDPKALARFVDQSVARTKDRLGYELYARIYWATLQSIGTEGLRDGEVDWPKMRQGFRDMERTFPDDWNRNAFAYYACEANDVKTALEVIARLGEPDLGVWKTREKFEACKSGKPTFEERAGDAEPARKGDTTI